MDAKLQDFVKKYAKGDDLSIKREAAKQMLVYNAFDPSGDIHDDFYSKVNTTNGSGYPKLIKNIGVAFSTSAPNRNSGKWLKVELSIGGEFLNKTFYMYSGSGMKQAGSYLPLSSTTMWGAAWFATWELVRYTDPTFIPHNSALDMVNGSSKFDVTIIPSYTHFHDDVPDEIVVPLLYELDLLPPLAASILGPSTREPDELGTWAASPSGGTASYTYSWEYKLTCSFGSADESEVACGQWHPGGTGSSFTRSTSSSFESLELKLTVTDTYSHKAVMAHKAVQITDPVWTGSYPNPFNPSTVVRFTLQEATRVSVRVYDIAGREVLQLADRTFSAGTHGLTFDASSLPSGVYFYRLRTPDYSATRSMLLTK